MPLLLRDGATAHVLALRAEGELFNLLGTPAALGRTLSAGDAHSTHAVISHGLWISRFGGSAAALGQPLVTDDQVWTIVGVMPPRFDVPNAAADLWLPLPLDQTVPGRFAHMLRVLVRMPDGATPEDVRRDLGVVAAQLSDERPGQNRGWSVTVRPLFATVVSPEFARSLWLIMGAVLFTLLMASATVAGLLLARATARDCEFAVRLALGATRGELVRMLLGECLVLAAAAGALGLLLALWGIDAVKAFGPTSVPRIDEVAIDGRVGLFAAFATVGTALVAVIAPAWQATRRVQDRLRVREAVTGAATSRLRDVLVGLQVATAVLLLVGAALLAQTAINLRGRELGFDVNRLVTAQVILPASPAEAQTARRGWRRTGPGWRSFQASAASPSRAAAVFGTEQRQHVRHGRLPATGSGGAGYGLPGRRPEYFATMGIPLRTGRGIGEADGPGNPSVVISETAARRLSARPRSPRPAREARQLRLDDDRRRGRRRQVWRPRRPGQRRAPDDVHPAPPDARCAGRARRARRRRAGQRDGRDPRRAARGRRHRGRGRADDGLHYSRHHGTPTLHRHAGHRVRGRRHGAGEPGAVWAARAFVVGRRTRRDSACGWPSGPRAATSPAWWRAGPACRSPEVSCWASWRAPP